MTERDPDSDHGEEPREDQQDGRRERGPESAGDSPRREPTLPPDEEAAWAQIVAAYDEAPAPDPQHPDGRAQFDAPPHRPDGEEERGGPDGETGTADDADEADEDGDRDARAEGEPTASGGGTGTLDLEKRPPEPRDGGGSGPESGSPVRSFTVYSAGSGPRDWVAPEEGDEGHFVPPEPPPVPRGDAITTFAWIAVLGGPLLLFGSVLLQIDLVWWIVTLGVGGFLGGFGTLVARMRDGRDDDDWHDPGRGAVV